MSILERLKQFLCIHPGWRRSGDEWICVHCGKVVKGNTVMLGIKP